MSALAGVDEALQLPSLYLFILFRFVFRAINFTLHLGCASSEVWEGRESSPSRVTASMGRRGRLSTSGLQIPACLVICEGKEAGVTGYGQVRK